MKKFWIVLSVCWLWTCSGGSDGESPTEPTGPNYVVNLSNLGGSAQKGPFNNGTSINIAELSNALAPTGKNYSSQITDNSGRFNVAQVQLESPYVELRANGYYFNEVSNQVSSGQLTLYAISNLSGKTSLNVNILTHLEKNRIINLMSGDNPLTYAQAKIQAQEEVLNIFEYSRANMPESELLDISKSGSANGKLLAISAILQGDQTVGQMSELLANISTDITADGTIENTTIRNTLINNAANLDFEQIRSNLVARYASLGVSATIPNFETEVNQFLKPPVAQDMSASTAEDTAINITLAGSDPEGESLTYTIVEVNNATVTLNGNVANYTPDANFNGTDTFTYKANDGTSDSNIATVTMTVSGEDDDPNTQNAAATTDEDVAVVLQLTAEEYDGDSYSFGIISQPTNGSVSLDGANATYTPNQDYNGTDSFTFEATDDTGRMMNVGTATITINPVNDAPFAPDMTIDMVEDGTGQFIISSAASDANFFRINATDIENDALTFQTISVNNATYDLVDNNNELAYYPNQDFNGQDTFQYTVSDGTEESNTGTITVNISGVNDAPTTNDVSTTIDENRTARVADLTLDGNDVDEDNLTYSLSSNPSNGTASINGNILTYNANQDWNGVETFTYIANDGEYDSNISTVTISVNPINDAPVSSDTSIATRENVPLVVTFDAADIDGDNLTYSILTQPTNGTLSTGNNIDYAYTPNNSFIGTDTFTYVANDGTVNSNTSTVTVTVISGSAPIALTSNLSISYETEVYEYTTDLSGSAIDPDGDPLTFYIDSQPDIGSATIDGSIITYTIDQTQIGNSYQTSFTWYANDGANNSNIADLIISVDLTLGGYIVDISEYDHDAYTTNFTSGLRASDVSYIGQKNSGSTGFIVGNYSGLINAYRFNRDFDRFDYWQDEYSVELNFNERSLAWSYIGPENILTYVPFSMYIIHNDSGDRIRLFIGFFDKNQNNTWDYDPNNTSAYDPFFGVSGFERIYGYVPTDINAPYDPSKDSQYITENDLITSGGCGWSSDCNFPDDYLDSLEYEISYPFVTALIISHKNIESVGSAMVPPTGTNQQALNTGYTTGSAIYFKTDKSSSRTRNKNLGPIFIKSTIDDEFDNGFDDYEYIEK